MKIDDFSSWLEKNGYPHDEETIGKFVRYYELLVSFNGKFNLTSLTSFDGVFEKHFIDSLLFPLSETQSASTLLDLGTGAGFPGIPLKIVYPYLKLYLLESNGKKVSFLKHLISELGLENVTVVQERAEQYVSSAREAFKVVVSRAVAPLNILLELAIPLLQIDGEFRAYKGKNMQGEMILTGSAGEKLRTYIKSSLNTMLPFRHEERNLAIFSKKEATPSVYPRSYKEIKNSPL